MQELFPERPFLIGVVHLQPTPGSALYPRHDGDPQAVVESALNDSLALVRGGCDGLIVENFGDVPFFPETVPPETVAMMARVLVVIGTGLPQPKVPVGVNVLRNDARAALGLAAAGLASFLRINVHTGAMLTDQGLLQGRAAETMRLRPRLAPSVRVLADVHVKHGTLLGNESIGDAARDTLERGLADAVIVTGRATGEPPTPALVAEVRAAIGTATLIVGSGVTAENAGALLAQADGAIVGTSLKFDGGIEAAVDPDRVAALRAALR